MQGRKIKPSRHRTLLGKIDAWPEAQLEAETGGLMKKIEHVSVLSSQFWEGIVENNHSRKKQRHTYSYYIVKNIDRKFRKY